MKHLLLTLSLCIPLLVNAQESGNYKPDKDKNVKLTQTNLPIVFINTQKNGNTQMIMKEDRINVRMKIIYNGEGKLNYGDTIAHPDQKVDYDGYIGIKYRGNSSFNMAAKKPYAIRPQDANGKKQKVSILGMGKDNDWALLAMYADKTLIRDMLAFTLARPYFDYVPNGKFCELILDGIYYGVFTFSERVREGEKRINIGDPGDSGDALTGGYHLEIDRPDEAVYQSKYHPKANGKEIMNKYISFQYKSPEIDDLTEAQKNYIHGHIDAFEKALASDNFKDPETGYRKYIDVTSFIDYMLSTEFSHNNDGYRLSTNLYKKRDSVDPLFKMSLWDMNLGFGNANYYGAERYDTWMYEFNETNSNNDDQLVPFWWEKLMRDPAYVKELKTRWTKYRNEVYSDEGIAHTIDSLTNVLNQEGAADRNFQAWNLLGNQVWPNYFVGQTYEEEINYLNEWIDNRVQFMDNAWYDESLTSIETEKIDNTKYPVTTESGAIVVGNLPKGSSINLYTTLGCLVSITSDCSDLVRIPIENNGTYILKISTPQTSYSTKVLYKK